MPNVIRVPCGYPGCPVLVEANSGGCDKHRKTRRNNLKKVRMSYEPRYELDRFYSTARWQRARKMYIREYPMCAMCNGVGHIVDHIVPRAHGGADLDAANFQTLCVKCHAIKTADDATKFSYTKTS